MRVFGHLAAGKREGLERLVEAAAGLRVQRSGKARSSTPFPKSTDLELALRPLLQQAAFQHHVKLVHPHTGVGFEYDFWRPAEGVALEVMGYRADDEVDKNLLKFHVHDGVAVQPPKKPGGLDHLGVGLRSIFSRGGIDRWIRL